MIFKQFDFRFNHKKFILEEDGLRVVSRSMSKMVEDFYDFHTVGNKITRKKRRYLLFLLASLLSFLAGIILFLSKGSESTGTFWIAVGILFLVIYYFTGKNFIYLSDVQNDTHIQLLNDNFNRAKSLEFIDKILQAQKERMIELYGKFDNEISIEENFIKLKWLKDNGFLDDDEYESRKQLLVDKINSEISNSNIPESNKIGFKRNNEDSQS